LGLGFVEVVEGAFGVGLHGGAARLPASWADLAVLIGELEGLNQAEGFVDRSANWKIVDGDLAENSFVVDDVKTSVGDSFVFLEAAVSLGDSVGGVGKDWDLHLADASLLAASFGPRKMGEDRISGSSDDGAVALLKGGGGFREGDDLSWADEGEVEGVEEENNIFAFVVAEGNFFELAVDQSVGLEGRGGLADLSFSGGHVFL